MLVLYPNYLWGLLACQRLSPRFSFHGYFFLAWRRMHGPAEFAVGTKEGTPFALDGMLNRG
jgi:hypothetical protein